ncbi:MAG: sugar ABC transporter ATP-binding protein [Treponema sp.]|nr:sugar ABC transporter ATP-binding protein [Treponema sp.]
MGTDAICLRAEHITKVFPGTKALKDVSFNVYKGKVNVLIGENGAGKSTLMKILAGIQKPTEGKMYLVKDDGSKEELQLKDTTDARMHGIGMINQELSLFPNLNVYQNMFMAREETKAGVFLDNHTHEELTKKVLARLAHPIPPETIVGTLRVGQQQIIEIARNILQENLKILIMDEPTSSLSKQEVDVLFNVIHDLTSHGISIIYISHRLEEILQIGDYVTVLRDGSYIGEEQIKNIDMAWMVRGMIGEDVEYTKVHRDIDWESQDTILEVKDLSLPKPGGGYLLNNVSFNLKKGEVLGIYGLLGSGRTELFECIMGLQPTHTGKIYLEGKELTVKNIADQIQNGFAIVPEDRQKEGLVQTLDIQKNISLSSLKRYVKGLLIDSKGEDGHVDSQIQDVHIKVADKHLPILSLSGGNQQKCVIAKAILTQPKILLLDEPSRGIDIGAKTEVFDIIREYANKGLSIIVVSSELNEITTFTDRIIVLSNGVKTAEINDTEYTKDKIVFASYKGHETA